MGKCERNYILELISKLLNALPLAIQMLQVRQYLLIAKLDTFATFYLRLYVQKEI